MAQTKYGTGTVSQRKKDNKWIWTGYYKDNKGKVHRPIKVFDTEEKALIHQAQQLSLKTAEKEKSLKGYTVNDVYEKWFDSALNGELKISQTTIKNSSGNLKKHILPQIGTNKINKINTHTLKVYFNSLTLSQKTKYNIYCDLLLLIKYAKDKKYIYENPLGDFVIKNQTKKKVVNVLYANEYKRIIENERNKKSYYYNLIVFLAETGLRISEVAFKESDYIVTESGLHLLYVDKTLHRVLINDKETVVKLIEDVKNKESERYIPLNLFAQNAVENQLAYKKEHNIRTPFIFTSKTGTLLDKDNVGRAFRSMCKNADIPLGRGLHSLRKRYINHTLKAGVTPQDLAKTTGHSPQTMLKYYHEIDEDILRQIADTSESRTEYAKK